MKHINFMAKYNKVSLNYKFFFSPRVGEVYSHVAVGWIVGGGDVFLLSSRLLLSEYMMR